MAPELETLRPVLFTTVTYVTAVLSCVVGASCPVKAEELSTETVAVVGEVCVIVLGVTVSVNVQVPVSLKVSESVPETVYAPTLSGAPMTLMAPLAETLMLALVGDAT
jgi:arginine exporter protein ArgO